MKANRINREGVVADDTTTSPPSVTRELTRRAFFKAAGGTLVAGAGSLALIRATAPSAGTNLKLAALPSRVVKVGLVATDGFVSFNPNLNGRNLAPYFPDANAPAGSGLNTYVFGFRQCDPTSSISTLTQKYKGKAQASAPNLRFNVGDDIHLTMFNLGFVQRPDLVDAHTVHWHGFPNAIPLFDGVPDASLSVPVGDQFTYRFVPQEPGLYMYHCHVEDAEHVTMGLVGVVAVYPKSSIVPSGQKWAYNDPSTRFDVEQLMMLNEWDPQEHYRDGHKQDSDWTEFEPSWSLINGRMYPDTVKAGGPTIGGFPESPDVSLGNLQYQPISSLVQARVGQRILLRMSNLGFQEHSMVIPGLNGTLIGRDGKFLGAGRDGYTGGANTRGDATTITNRLDIGPGESRDLLIDTTGAATGTYFLYDRNAQHAGTNLTGMRTEIRLS